MFQKPNGARPQNVTSKWWDRLLVNKNIFVMTNPIDKKFKIPGDKIVDLIGNIGACMATYKITVDGLPVGYMYREEPDNEIDNGWRFFSGTENQEYVDDPNNTAIYNTNTIANYDKAIIPYLVLPEGTELERNDDNSFSIIKQ